MALTRENTAALNAVCGLTAAQRGLETGLTATRKTMFADPVTQRRQEVEERDGLVRSSGLPASCMCWGGRIAGSQSADLAAAPLLLQVQLVNAQAKELERLRAQVMALRRKDTSVYN
jgi:hypothetical protein